MRRHALDWLRAMRWEDGDGYPHWCHSHYADDPVEYDSSDSEDDACLPYPIPSMYPCPVVPGRSHPHGAVCHCAQNQ